MNPLTITSAQNPKLKAACELRDSKTRRKQKRFLIDGIALIRRAIEAGVSLEQLFLLDALSTDFADVESLVRTIGVETYRVAPTAMEKLQYGERNLQAIAVAKAWDTDIQSTDWSRQTKLRDENILVLDRVEKPGNLGAALRTADAAGVSAVLLSDPICDVFNPNTVRSSLGGLFTVPIGTGRHDAIAEWLTARDYSIYTARVEGAIAYSSVAYPSKAAFVLGNEADGLGDRWQSERFQSVAIPMLGKIDSLNVSVSSSVLLYEYVRQHRRSST